MRCTALLFNLDKEPNRNKPGTINRWLTFVDMDTGTSYRTFVDEMIADQFVKMKTVDMVLSITEGEFRGRPQLNIRVISISDHVEPADEKQAEIKAEAKPLFPGKTGTNG